MSFFVFSILFLIYTACFVYMIMLAWLIRGWTCRPRVSLFEALPPVFVSVIIPARNEEDNITDCLKDLIAQSYPGNQFEIIVVDDGSSDNTPHLVNSVITDHKDHQIHLIRLTPVEKAGFHKKQALKRGIDTARGKLIITTDADCRYGTKWIAAIVSCYCRQKPKMIAGPVCYHQEYNWFGKMQSLEFLSVIGTGFASANQNKLLLCNGANLAYEKEAFYQAGAFQGDRTASGDDISLMQKFNQLFPGKICFLSHKEAIVYTKPASTLRVFINQRVRWISKTVFYKENWPKFMAITVLVVNVLLFPAFLLSLINGGFVEYFFIPLIVKCFIDFLFLFLVLSWFKKRSLLIWFIPNLVIYWIYIAIIAIGCLYGSYEWKGRKVALNG